MILFKNKPRYRLKVENYVSEAISDGKINHIVQIGANDGVQNDPIRFILKKSGSYTATLVEPLPYYTTKLKAIYHDRTDIRIECVAAGDKQGTLKLYYIDPLVADEMNGDGPQNNWAHGQGSFDKSIVVDWINKNRFRGDKYIQSIPRFIAAIQETIVEMVPTRKFIDQPKQTLLLIDVQGAEKTVLSGVDWEYAPPKSVIVENDLKAGKSLRSFMRERGYAYVGGNHDLIFEKN